MRFRDSIIRRRLKELGVRSITEFLAQHPAVPYERLAPTLSTDGSDVLPVQLLSLQCEEALASGDAESVARDSLARSISKLFPDGWEDSPDDLIPRLSADWIGKLETRGLKDFADALQAVHTAIKENQPQLGWRPSGPRDPYIDKVFSIGWSRSGPTGP